MSQGRVVPEAFRVRLRRALAALEISQAEAAEILGVSTSTIEAWLAEAASKSRKVPHPLMQAGVFHLLAQAQVAAAWCAEPSVVAATRRPGQDDQVAPPDAAEAPARSRWTKRETALLGTAPDAEVARLLARSRLAVSARRAALGIPAFGPDPQPAPAIDERYDRLLGTAPDRVIAERLGVPLQVVFRRRKALGIPARHPKTRRTVEDTE